MIAFAIAAAFFFPIDSAQAGFWEALASASHTLTPHECLRAPSSEPRRARLSNEEKCEFRVDPVRSLRTGAELLSEETYLGALAQERIEDNKCVLEFVDRIKKSPAELGKRVAKATEAAEGIHRELTTYNRAKHELLRLTGMRDKDQKKIDELRQSAAKSLSVIAVYESSIPLSDLEPVKELLEGISRRVSTIAVSSGVSEPPKFDRAEFERDFKDAMTRSRQKVESDNRTLKQGVESKGAGLDRYARESLAQDHDLVEKFFKKNLELRQPLKGAMCAVDAKYGRGAETRDQIMFWGSVALSAGSLGVGFVGRVGVGAAVAATTPVRIAAASGNISSKMARMLGTPAQMFGRVVVGVDIVTGMNEIAKSCFGYQAQIQTRTEGGREGKAVQQGEGKRCASFTVEDLDMQDCVRDSALLALGITVASPTGQRVIARAMGAGPQATHEVPRAGVETPATTRPRAPTAEPDPLKPPEVAPARPKPDLPAPAEADRLSQAESDKIWRERSMGFKKKGFTRSLQENQEVALNNKTSFGRFMERLGYEKLPNGKFKKPSLERVLTNYNKHVDDLIKRGVVKEDEVIRPVAIFRDEAGNSRTLRFGERIPKGWKYDEGIMSPDEFMDLIAKGRMPIGGFQQVGRFNMVSADHDIAHLAGFAMNPRISKDLRAAAAQARAAQNASAEPRLLQDRLYQLMEHGHYVPSSHRSTIRHWDPKLFKDLRGPQPFSVFENYVKDLPMSELEALAKRVSQSSPRITRNFGGLQVDELDGAVWGLATRHDLSVGRGVRSADSQDNREWLLRRSVARSLQGSWNGTYIDPRTMVRDFIDPTTPSGQRLRRVICMHAEWSRRNHGDVDGFKCNELGAGR